MYRGRFWGNLYCKCLIWIHALHMWWLLLEENSSQRRSWEISASRLRFSLCRGRPVARSNSHVIELKKAFKSFNNGGHSGSVFRVQASTLEGKTGHSLCAFHRILPTKPWIYYAMQSARATEVWLCPIH